MLGNGGHSGYPMDRPMPRLAPTKISTQTPFTCIMDIVGAKCDLAPDARSIRE
jgi:hypothetical protein